jgi:hypothetical protein
MMGIADPDYSDVITVATEEGLSPTEVLGALRWDSCNPWARFLEKLSSHPIVVHRIAALERSGLPGAPTGWGAARVAASCQGPELEHARRRFPFELVVKYAWAVALFVVVFASRTSSTAVTMAAVTLGGAGFLLRAMLMNPPGRHQPVERVASLLERLDASPVTSIPVQLHGRVIGRGVPGYALSPELVVQDESGFVPVLYLQPLPFARAIFALAKAGRFADQAVDVRGWYRRGPSPYLELRDIVAEDGTRSRSRMWTARYVAGALAFVIGLLGLAATMT